MAFGNTTSEVQQEIGMFADEWRGERIRHRLGIVRRVALVDLVLLIALVSSSLTDRREFVQVLGPLHGVNFLLLRRRGSRGARRLVGVVVPGDYPDHRRPTRRIRRGVGHRAPHGVRGRR